VQAQQRHLPEVTGERVRTGVLDPGPVQVPTQIGEQPSGRRVVLHATAFADRFRVGLAQRRRPGQPAEQGPHLCGIQRRRGQVTLLQRVECLDARQLAQPGQAELVHPEPGLRRGHPPGQSTVRPSVRICSQVTLVVETAEPAAGDLLAGASGDQAVLGARERAGPGGVVGHRLGRPGAAPGVFVP
jgi:hypothetical protein